MAARILPPKPRTRGDPQPPPVDGRRQTAGDDRHPAPDPAVLLRALLDPVGRLAAWGPRLTRRRAPRPRDARDRVAGALRPLHAPGLRQLPRVLLDPARCPTTGDIRGAVGVQFALPPIGQPPNGGPALPARPRRDLLPAARRGCGGEPPVPGAGQEFARLNPERGPAGSHIGSSPPRAPASRPRELRPDGLNEHIPRILPDAGGAEDQKPDSRARFSLPCSGSSRRASSAPPRGARRRTSP